MFGRSETLCTKWLRDVPCRFLSGREAGTGFPVQAAQFEEQNAFVLSVAKLRTIKARFIHNNIDMLCDMIRLGH